MTIQNDAIPTQIIAMVLMQIKTFLETAMVEEVALENPTRAVLVKIGRFQDNPISKNVSIAISGGDYENPAFLDARIDDPAMVKDYPFRNLPVGEIGGGHYWYRRGTINFQCFFVRQRFDEETAMQYAYDFYGRLLHNVELVPLNNLRDDYLEGPASGVIVESASMFESGGNDRFIWRGKLFWRILTWRP
jgi:hypothetical protein